MKYPWVLAAALCFFACAQQPDPAVSGDGKAGKPDPSVPDTERPQKKATEKFFPIADYMKGEIAYVDSLPVGIMQYISSPAGKDSGWLNREKFHELAGEFLPAEIVGETFEKLFEERSLFDKSSGTSTFFYSARSDSSALRRVDVVTAPGDVYDEVRSVYLEKRYHSKGTDIVRRMIWKPKRNFQIITQSVAEGSTPQATLVKVVWDNRD